ncbi:MAG: hypothetical protein KF869_01240 [Phycisphaeraceae bacterium]|nr:hypothetical protein [Phycisphaeraceae bacterium]
MHDRRNALLAIVLLASFIWALVAWLLIPEVGLWLPGLVWHRIASVLLAAAAMISLYFALASRPTLRH